MRNCWYVTASWAIHDQRWLEALLAQGFEPNVISLERDSCTIEDAKGQLIAAAKVGDVSPVLAGPLTTVTSQLVDIPQRLVGLSWGFDLLGSHELPENLNRLDHLIVDSPASADVAAALGVPSDVISSIYWGTDLDTFTPDGLTVELQKFGVQESGHTVLSLRAHEDFYRVGDLVEAWPVVVGQQPDAHLLIGNSGSLTETLQTRVEECGLLDSVHFIGRVSETELSALLRSVSLYVSTSPVDGTSVTLLQAMASGCPVLVTDELGNRHWISPGETGYLFNSGGVENLSLAIMSALAKTGTVLQDHIVQRALQRVRERADWSRNQRLLRKVLIPE